MKNINQNFLFSSKSLVRRALILGISLPVVLSATAQDAIPNRKPSGAQATSPSTVIGELPEKARDTDFSFGGSVSGTPIPHFDRIDTPIRWYAIENEANEQYWRGVNPERIWVRLEEGFSFDRNDIADFLLAQGLSEVVRESTGPGRGDLRIFSVPGLTPAEVVDMARAAQNVSGIEVVEPAPIFTTYFTPNDPLYQYQWGPYATGFQTAWDFALGGNSWNVVSVIDDACDWFHEDLFDIVWYGWDYAQNDFDIYPDDPSTHKHGTHVTGTVAAKTNNGVGVAGMVSDTVYFAKVGNPDGTMSDVGIYDALYDIAAISRITVINMSLGSESPNASIEMACNYAWNNGKLPIVASGNNGQGMISYPAAYLSTVAVGSIGTNGSNLYLTSYSQYGNEQELVAPGGDMSTNFGVLSTVPMNLYEAMEGTSMASPHVAGLAGLMKHVNMDLSNIDIRNIMAATATDFGDPGWDPVFGYGMINATAALNAAYNFNVGTSRVDGEVALRIYPNPTVDRILLDRINSERGVYRIYDPSGRVLSTGNVDAEAKPTIDVSQLNAGIYFFQLETERGEATVRFVKY